MRKREDIDIKILSEIDKSQKTKKSGLTVSELARELDYPRTTVSDHVRTLIQTKKLGRGVLEGYNPQNQEPWFKEISCGGALLTRDFLDKHLWSTSYITEGIKKGMEKQREYDRKIINSLNRKLFLAKKKLSRKGQEEMDELSKKLDKYCVKAWECQMWREQAIYYQKLYSKKKKSPKSIIKKARGYASNNEVSQM